jgi:hypothetical protein
VTEPKKTKHLDIHGLEALPWDAQATGQKAPSRAFKVPLPNMVYVACSWRVPPTKGTPAPRFFWRAGIIHGMALNIEDGKQQADASLLEQGVILG